MQKTEIKLLEHQRDMHKKNYEQVIKVDELRANQKKELKLLKEERDLYKR